MGEYVTQQECENRRSNIAKDYDELAERVRKTELNESKDNERIKTLFTFVKFLSGIAAAVLGSTIMLIIKGALNI